MDTDVLSFFDEHMDSLAFYEAFESSVKKEIKDPGEIDEELMGWIKEAAAFSDKK